MHDAAVAGQVKELESQVPCDVLVERLKLQQVVFKPSASAQAGVGLLDALLALLQFAHLKRLDVPDVFLSEVKETSHVASRF